MPGIVVLGGAAVREHLSVVECIDALDDAFRHAGRAGSRSFFGGAHAPNGTFHIKAALADLRRPLFAAKLNGNFPGNHRYGLPTIQGVLVLSDADNGSPLAIMDSGALTIIRTAAASGVAARYLAPPDASALAVIGCGAQAEAHVTAMRAVRPVQSIRLHDTNAARARALAERLRSSGLDVGIADSIAHCTDGADIIVTSTTATSPFLDVEHVGTGAFVAAVGADNPHKSEITPALLAAATLVVDDADQCASSGDLHHALHAGAVERSHVWHTLASVVCDAPRPPGQRPVVFDSTGIALEDVAAAALVYERARGAADVHVLSLA